MSSLGIGQHRPAASSINSWLDRWTNFWFAPADPAPLGLMRLLVGGMLVYSHIVWGIDLQAFLGPDGWNSAELIQEFQRNQWNLSFWWYIPQESMQFVHYCCIGILILFWIGLLTRITSILSYIILVSYCQRATLSNYGMDQICGLLTLYLVIGPSGAAYSVDNLLIRLWRFLRWDTFQHEQPLKKSASAGLALRLIQVHYCIIYFFAGTGKLQGEAWWTGEAMWRVIANYEYQSFDLLWLAHYPEILELMTHIVILWELSFAYLIWSPLARPWMLTMGTLMHIGIGAFFGMWTFGLSMIFGYVAFLKPETIRRFLP